MSPRRPVAEVRATRAAIVERAVDRSSVQGLEGLSFGALASDVGMSKGGVLRHFATKEELQLAAVEAAIERFRREVWDASRDAVPGVARLAAICEAWISYLDRDVFPGGCYLTAASCELNGRPGPVREALAEALRAWYRALESQARAAIEAGELPAGTDPAEIALELNGLAMGANQLVQLLGDDDALARARRAMLATLGVRPVGQDRQAGPRERD